MDRMRSLMLAAGRIAIAGVFIYDATLLARFPAPNVEFMERFGAPGILLWPTAAFQLFAGLAIVLGIATRLAALALAGFCAMTALVFHNDLGTINETVQFGKDFGLAGGFLFLAASGAGAWSLDARLGTDLWPLRRG